MIDYDNAWDMNLNVWEWISTVGPDHEPVFHRAGEVRLGRYLLTWDKMGEFEGYMLVRDNSFDPVEILGKIIEIALPTYLDEVVPGHWVVEKDGIIDIFPGKVEHKPVRLAS